MRRLAVAAASLLLMAAASDPADQLPDPAAEAHARALFAGIRCVVCQNESIDDSEADLARDLRQTIRSQVAAGQSDDQIRAFLVARYGDFILLKPPLRPATALLWGAPFAIVLIGAAWLAVCRAKEMEPELSAAEIKALKALENEPDDLQGV